MFQSERSSTAASAIASGRNGITRNQSVIRISTVSIHPPKNPAVMPISEPIAIVSTVAANPTSNETREPHTNWAATERPR